LRAAPTRSACRGRRGGHLRALRRWSTSKAAEAATGSESLGETRQLLFASLLLADEIKEQRSGNGAGQADASARPKSIRS
jgi:hypothetical protein